jgi:hypothetical protein
MIGYVKRITPQVAEQLVKGQADEDIFFEGSAEDERMGQGLNLDKAWDGIDFLFQNGNRKNNPDSAFLGAKKPLYLEEEFGYGPVMLIPVSEAVRIGEQLARISDEDFSQRCATHHAALLEQEVYPFSVGETVEEIDAYLTPYFKEVRGLFARAASAGELVMFWVM